jgi:putative nucleotidyltransferase with HDIG domain
MIKEFASELRHSHNKLARFLLAIVAIAIIVALLPKEAHFKYEFEAGKPWLHDDLLAPFDFAIIKSDKQKEEERAEINSFTKPFFTRENEAAENAIENFKLGLSLEEDRWDSTKIRGFEKWGVTHLKEIYGKGIIENHEVLTDESAVNIVSDHREKRQPLSGLYTLQEAADYVSDHVSESAPSDSIMVKNLVIENLKPNLAYNPDLTEKVIQQRMEEIADYYGKVEKNEKIISRGEIVDKSAFQKLKSFETAYLKRYNNAEGNILLIIGQVILVTIVVFVLLFYMAIFRPDIFNELNKFSLILTLFVLFVVFAVITTWFDQLNIYLLPICILPIVIRNFFESRIASFVHVITIITIGLYAPNGFEYVFIQIMTGLIALFTLTGLLKRAQFLTSAFVIFITYSLMYLGFTVIKEGHFTDIDYNYFLWFGGSAMLTLLAYPVIFIFEKLFKLISDLTLLELSDTNNELLKQLNLKAPGTFQHSMQVANLAEEASSIIGADSLLVRTGALYHDIGKMKNPAYFIENQSGNANPHNQLTYAESAKVIINHVIKGIEMAKKKRLPEQIIDFIRTHHGTTVTRYFYYKARQENESVNMDDFQYPGPIPFSKETAILMMADSVEAASRSLKNYEVEKLEELVDQIIDSQLNEDQFIHADITLRDISRIKKVFKKRLKNIYHVRIEYPDKA